MPASDTSRTTTMVPSQARFQNLRTRDHPYCFVCSQSNPFGMGVGFILQSDGSVTATLHSHAALEGFEGCVHGGIIASLLDGAMTNCLFAHGLVAMTAELKVRYRKPVRIGPEILLRGRITRPQPPLYLLEAELHQEGCVRAVASGKFIERDGSADHNHDAGRE